jgi:hypothetical protein
MCVSNNPRPLLLRTGSIHTKTSVVTNIWLYEMFVLETNSSYHPYKTTMTGQYNGGNATIKDHFVAYGHHIINWYKAFLAIQFNGK